MCEYCDDGVFEFLNKLRNIDVIFDNIKNHKKEFYVCENFFEEIIDHCNTHEVSICRDSLEKNCLVFRKIKIRKIKIVKK